MSVWLEIEAGGRKTGNVCARDYRNGDNCPLIVRTTSEDVLVGNVFGMLRLVTPQVWLRPLLNLAFKTRRFDYVPLAELAMGFWQRVPPRSVRRLPEGDSEIDVLLRFDDCSVFIEAKFEAPLSTSTRHDAQRDQLLRILDVAYDNTRCGLWRSTPYVLVLGLDLEPPILVRRYSDLETLAAALGYHPHEDARARAAVLARRVGYLAWAQLRDIIANPNLDANLTEQRICFDLVRYLDLKCMARRSP
jgi:hypothetical protein